jgi:hypothetical protein
LSGVGLRRGVAKGEHWERRDQAEREHPERRSFAGINPGWGVAKGESSRTLLAYLAHCRQRRFASIFQILYQNQDAIGNDPG